MDRLIYAFLAVGLFLLAAPAGASAPDTITLSTGTEWVTAGSGETSTVTVQVQGDGASLPGITVTFTVDGTDGTISPAQAVTGIDGKASAIFKPGTVAGTATITATVSHEELDEPLTKSVDQKIDHAAPYVVAGLQYDSEVTAGDTADIVIRMHDKYGNLVDNRRTAETVTFTVGQIAGGTGATFIGGTDEITVAVDAEGNAAARLQVDTKAGPNIVSVTFPGSIAPRPPLIIVGRENGEPAEIYMSISPNVDDPNPDYYPELPLGEQFTITCALYDEYNNPAGNRQIEVTVQPISGFLNPETLTLKTNSKGKAQFIYRSFDRIGVAEITATALDDSSVSCKQKLGFYSATPTGMVLTAVPQTIASGDVKDDIVSLIKAKVIDSRGNPVQNESVSFKIINFECGEFLLTVNPSISDEISVPGGDAPITAITDKDGFATVYLHPGYFTRNTSHVKYSNMASGSATIQAEWNGMQKDTTVSFRNYPYLSVNVTVEPQIVAVNSTVDVKIQLIGDGWALQTRPVDVVLCTDRSGSMLQNTTYTGSASFPTTVVQESIDDRMVHAMRAAKIFVSQMQSAKDRIGLVSFGQNGKADLTSYTYHYWVGNDYIKMGGGWYSYWISDSDNDAGYIAMHYKNPQIYEAAATRDLELTSDYANVNNTIDKWLPCGGTPMREGLYQSVQMILYGRDGRTAAAVDPVEAIVLLTDGNYSTSQNPEGGKNEVSLGSGIGTGSVINYAKNNNIKIFTIALGKEPSHADLQSYAEKTGGKFYSAAAGDDLTLVYEDIATKLQEAAGVDTTMDLAFDRVTIDSTPSVEGVFEYVYDSPESTRMEKYWTENKTTIWGPECKDQRGSWNDRKYLSFEVGDIYLHQTWETTFRLKVLKDGNIDIFGSDSAIKFNGTVGEAELGLPHTFITASHNLSEFGGITADIWLTRGSLNTDDPGILVPSWDLIYTGNRSVTQKVMYEFSQDNVWWDGNWHSIDTLDHPADTDVNGTYSTTLNLGEKEGWYKIRVFAQENTHDDDGATAEVTWTESIWVGTSDRAYIKIS